MEQALSLDKYKPDQVNMLVPTQHLQQVSPWHAIRVSEVKANPDPAAGDVFKVGSRYDVKAKKWEDLFCPAKPLLMKISTAAGIVWNWHDSGPLSLNRDYVSYKAIGALRLPDGSWQPVIGTKEIDLTVIEEEIYEQNLKKAKEMDDKEKKKKLGSMTVEQWAQKQTKVNMIQWRKNKLMRAETGAMLRVVRAALAMKGQYTKEEIMKPFVVPRIDFNPDYSDPSVRQALIQHGIQAMSNLFGQMTPGTPQILPGGGDVFTHPAIEAPTQEPHDENGAQDLELQPTGEERPVDDDTPPWTKDAILCKGCDCIIEATGKWTAEQIAEYSKKEFDQELCPKCQNKARKAKKAGGAK